MSLRKPSRKQPSHPGKASNAGPASRAARGLSLDVSNRLAYTVLVVFTLVAFANAWPNNLVFDDRIFVDLNRFSSLEPGDFLRFFTEDLWAASGADSKLYRPLFLLLIAAESLLFGEWKAGYHLANIGLHVVATLLVYGFIRRLLQICGHPPAEARQFALLAALLFGVHPIHTEVVNSVFNGSETLVAIGVMGGLSWLLDHQHNQPLKAWMGLNVVFLLILFCRESAAALPLLAVGMIWLTRTDSWRSRFTACLPVLSMVVPLGIYFALRSLALAAPDVAADLPADIALQTPGESPDDPSEKSMGPLARYGLEFGLENFKPAVLLWIESLKNLLWPYPLQIFYNPPETNFWLALVAQLLILTGAVVAFFRKQPLFLIGLAFFYLAFLPSSRIISEPGIGAILSDRLLYLPSVGFVIFCAWVLQRLALKSGFKAAAVTTLAIAVVMVPVCWARNSDWADDIRLFETDYRRLESKHQIAWTILGAQLRAGNTRRAVEICDENRHLIDNGKDVGAHCGTAYGKAGRYRDAEHAYLAVKAPSLRVFAVFNLGMMYSNLGRKAEAEERIAEAVALETKPFLKNYFRAVGLIQLHPNDRERLLEAQALLQEALELQPKHIESRQELAALNRKLGGEPSSR
jgi:tetratricopeptide (TPR) repeat protein